MNGGNTSNTTGENSVYFDYIKRRSGDCITDEVIHEISERLQAFLTSTGDRDVVFSPSAPTDVTKLWMPTDVNGVPKGKVHWYDAVSGKWTNGFDELDPIPLISQEEDNLLSEVDDGWRVARERKSISVTNGNNTISLTKFTNSNYSVIVEPRNDTGDNGRWWVGIKEKETCEINFEGLPSITTFDITFIGT